MKPAFKMAAMFAALAGIAVGQHVGDIPPSLVWNKLKGNCPTGLEWASLRGKVVIVSFTSDFVFPQDIIEWNELPEKLQGDPVVFVRVAAGPEFLLDQAVSKTPYRGCILFDSESANRRNLGLSALPNTMVVDDLGVIAGFFRGEADEKSVRTLLKHEAALGLSYIPLQPRSPDSPAALVSLPSYEVTIAPAGKGERRALGVLGTDQYISKNQSLKAIIMDLWETPMSRISFPENLDDESYDVTAHIPVDNSSLLIELVRDAVAKHFGLSVEKEQPLQDVYLLTLQQNPTSQLRPARDSEPQMSGGGPGSIIGTAQTMDEIASAFEGELQAPVINETQLKGKYDYSASSKLSEPQFALDLAHQLGLELTKVSRPIEMLVVRKAQ